jgi:hypothetical protein
MYFFNNNQFHHRLRTVATASSTTMHFSNHLL